MYNLDKAILERASAETGFVRDNLEKVYRLADVLDFISSNTYLKDKLVLKGGTAINLTVFDLPRLSFDIDLDLSQNCTREEMLETREEIEDLLVRYMTASGYSIDTGRGKNAHSLGSWAFSYLNAGGNRDNIKVEINYSMRAHILSPVERTVRFPFMEQDLHVISLAPQELFGSKIKALLERTAARDLYDIYNMIMADIFNGEELAMVRKCVIFYKSVGSTGPFKKDIKLDAIDALSFSKVRQTLLPVLRKGTFVDLPEMKDKVQRFLKELLQMTDEEKQYIEEFSKGRYSPELLFDDIDMVERIKLHPMALWKAEKIRQSLT